MATEKTDVVIVGVGAAGAILAAELAKAGMRVIALERGPRHVQADFKAMDELRFFQRQDTRPNPKRQPVTWRPNTNARATPLRVLNYGNQAGGGSVHYGAVSWRFHEDDFRARSHTIERYGAKAIPEDTTLADWPLTYTDLEPYYDKVEYDLGVSGKAGNLNGQIVEGGNPFEAPRKREFPLPPLNDDQAGTLFDEAANKLGYKPFASPHAIISRDYKGRAACTYCGFCQGFGCYNGAKSSTLVTHLPLADATGNFRLITLAMVYRVNSDNSERATGVSYWGPDGSDNTIEAEIVILAPFVFDNTRLLLLSKTAKFPNGLANSSGQVGKHFMAHVAPRVFAAFDDRYVNNYMGPNAQKHSFDEFNGDNFDHKDVGFIRGSNIAVATAGLEGGPIASAFGLVPPPGTPTWGAAYRDFFAKYFARHLVLLSEIENLPYADHTIDLDPDVKDAWGLPAPRVTYDWHRQNENKQVEFILPKLEDLARAMGAAHVWRAPLGAGQPGPHPQGGTRMGNNPRNSVVNKYSQSWDVPNLFIVGSSTNPSMSGFNPTLTIQALAYYTADAIANRYRKSPGPIGMTMRNFAVTSTLAFLLSAGSAFAAEHTLMPSPRTVHIGNFNATNRPVLTINSGDIVTLEAATQIEPEAVDASGVVAPSVVPQYVRDIYRDVQDRGPGPHVLTGPIFINGAMPGDVLELRILSVDLAVGYGYNRQRPFAGTLPDEFTQFWQRVLKINLQTKTTQIAPGVTVPLDHPFFGTMGVAPPMVMGRIGSGPPGVHTGNLDNKDLGAGSVLYMPVHVAGALFSAGDGHGAQGHGEVDLSAVETGLRGRFQFVVRKDMKLTWPRGETPTHWITMGLHEDLDEAMKIAVRETISFITTQFPKISREEAYAIASVAVDYHVTQVVDGTKGVHGMIPKAIFANR